MPQVAQLLAENQHLEAMVERVRREQAKASKACDTPATCQLAAD